MWYWVLGSIPGEAKRLYEFTPPMTIPGLKVCNEFITSKTFLLEFANYKTSFSTQSCRPSFLSAYMYIFVNRP